VSALKDEVVRARETLIASSDIGQSTSWSKKYPDSVFTHGQKEWGPEGQKEWGTSIKISSKQKKIPILSWSHKMWQWQSWSKQKIYPDSRSETYRSELRNDHHTDLLTAGKETAQESAKDMDDDAQEHVLVTIKNGEPRMNTKNDDYLKYYDPLKADKYIELRLEKMLEFYKSRLPHYTWSRNLMSVVLLIVTAAGTIFAYKQFSSYVSICAVVAAAITSWMEYNNIVAKIGRYNSTISSIESHILWWFSLPEVDQTVVKNIDALVKKGEQVLRDNFFYVWILSERTLHN
jgi:hypothetical protein